MHYIKAPDSEAIKITEWRTYNRIAKEWERNLVPKAEDITLLIEIVKKLAREIDGFPEENSNPFGRSREPLRRGAHKHAAFMDEIFE